MQPRDVLLLAIAVLAPACKHHAAAVSDQVPHTTGPIKIDGEWDEPDWARVALRHQFLGDDGQLSRPSSEVRFLHDDHDLIIALYAADDNIEHTDAFDLTIDSLALHADATGSVTPAVPGMQAKVGYDEGTIDNPKDDDEEWVVEIAIPLAALPPATDKHRQVHASRCDVTRDKTKRCGSWSGTISLP